MPGRVVPRSQDTTMGSTGGHNLSREFDRSSSGQVDVRNRSPGLRDCPERGLSPRMGAALHEPGASAPGLGLGGTGGGTTSRMIPSAVLIPPSPFLGVTSDDD